EENDNNNENRLLAITIQDIIKKAKFGLTILIIGLSVKVVIKCQVYRIIKEFLNESIGVNHNAYITTTSLVGKVMTFEKIIELAETSVKIALQSIIYHYKKQEKYTLP
ncbi:7353_t:CDS:2, partial [Funneliformis caledonium]